MNSFRFRQRYIVVCFMLLLTGILAWRLGTTRALRSRAIDFASLIPLSFEDWKGTPVAYDPNVYEILETNSVWGADYRQGGRTVNLTTVYYPNLKVDFHSPEGCNTGRGDELESRSERRIDLSGGGSSFIVQVTSFVVRRANGGRVRYSYLYVAPGYIGGNYFRMRWAVAKAHLLTRRSPVALVILSKDIGGSLAEDDATMDKIAGFALPHLSRLIES